MKLTRARRGLLRSCSAHSPDPAGAETWRVSGMAGGGPAWLSPVPSADMPPLGPQRCRGARRRRGRSTRARICRITYSSELAAGVVNSGLFAVSILNLSSFDDPAPCLHPARVGLRVSSAGSASQRAHLPALARNELCKMGVAAARSCRPPPRSVADSSRRIS